MTNRDKIIKRNRLSLPDHTALKAREHRAIDERDGITQPITERGVKPGSAYHGWYEGKFFEGLNSAPIGEVNRLSYYPELIA